ncbi:MAG: alpha-galactosidase [Phycisphaerae bacterium]|nr:alpha-galactosidase [Phycisphaerae bacterium]
MDLQNWLQKHFLDQHADLPFSLTYDGQPSSQWLARTPREVRCEPLDGGTRHTIVCDDPRTGLRITCELVAYDDFPAAEWVLHLENTGASDSPILQDIRALDAVFPRRETGEFVLHHALGSNAAKLDFAPRETVLPPHGGVTLSSAGGRSSNAADARGKSDGAFPFFNLAFDDGGLIVAIGWSGQWSARFGRNDKTDLRIDAGMELTHFKLLPGEAVRTPRILLFAWQGERLDGHNRFRQFILKRHTPTTSGKPPVPPFASNTWFLHDWGNGVTEQNQIETIRWLVEKGVALDAYWLDAGWYEGQGNWALDVGNWFPKKAAFPNGLKPVTDEAAKHGMGFVLWFEPERVHPGTWLHENHPEWLISPSDFVEEFRRRGNFRGESLLNLGHPEARDWLTDHISSMVEELGLTVYRQDFNMDCLDYWQVSDAADRQGITEIRHVEGLYAFWDELRRRHPHLLIDNCASGGRRIDLETISRSIPLWRSDYCFEPEGIQCQALGLNLYVPLSGCGFNTADRYVFRSHLSSAMSFCWDDKHPTDPDELKTRAEEFRAIRPLWFGDFYPLTGHSIAADIWAVWQLDRKDLNRGAVVALRRKASPYPLARLKLFGLDPNRTYEFRDRDTGTVVQAKGSQLMTDGLEIALPNQPDSKVLVYRAME